VDVTHPALQDLFHARYGGQSCCAATVASGTGRAQLLARIVKVFCQYGCMVMFFDIATASISLGTVSEQLAPGKQAV
jgi:hypothetical protein